MESPDVCNVACKLDRELTFPPHEQITRTCKPSISLYSIKWQIFPVKMIISINMVSSHSCSCIDHFDLKFISTFFTYIIFPCFQVFIVELLAALAVRINLISSQTYQITNSLAIFKRKVDTSTVLFEKSWTPVFSFSCSYTA